MSEDDGPPSEYELGHGGLPTVLERIFSLATHMRRRLVSLWHCRTCGEVHCGCAGDTGDQRS